MEVSVVEIIVSILVGLIVSAIVAVIVRMRTMWIRREMISKATISFRVTDGLRERGLRFGVLHVRDGKDEIAENESIVSRSSSKAVPDTRLKNKEHYMKENDDSYFITIKSIKYVRVLGFQYKCFVDYKDNSYAEIKQLLEEAGFLSVDAGGGKSCRAWFLLPECTSYITSDGHVVAPRVTVVEG